MNERKRLRYLGHVLRRLIRVVDRFQKKSLEVPPELASEIEKLKNDSYKVGRFLNLPSRREIRGERRKQRAQRRFYSQ